MNSDESTKKKILFIARSFDGESLGIEYLSAMLRERGHKRDLLLWYEERNFRTRLINKIRNFKPDFICFSVVTNNYLWASRIARLAKEIKDIPIVFGGIHVTSCPEEVIQNKFVDYAVLGEGEETIIELVENKNKNNIRNVWSKKGKKIIKNSLRLLIQNLDLLPFPDRELYYKEAPYLKNICYFMTSRGCPFNCTYCFNSYLKKVYNGERWYRRRSVKNAIEELKIIKSKWKPNYFFILDDCFTADKEWISEFCKEYKKEINLPFNFLTAIVFLDKKILSMLKYAGCYGIEIGVQTPIESIRRDICKRYETNELIKKRIDEIKKSGISVGLDHIFCLPTEKISDYNEGLKFYIDTNPTEFVLHKLQYYPNTEMIDLGLKYGNLTEKNVEDIKKGKINSGVMEKDVIFSKEIDEINNFLKWIPFFPKWFNLWLLKNRLYTIIPRNKTFNKLTMIIPYFYSIQAMKYFIRGRLNRIIYRRYLLKSRMEEEIALKKV